MRTFVWSGFSSAIRSAYVIVQAEDEQSAKTKVYEYLLKLFGGNEEIAQREYNQFGFVSPYVLDADSAPLILQNGEEDD